MNDKVLEQLRKLWDDNGEVEDVNPKSTHKKYWSCSRCHQQYQATVHTMIVAYKKTGWACPSCSGRIVVKGYNDLATTDPDIAKWLDPSVDGSSIPCGKRTDLPFTCENGHHYRATIRQMRKGVHCPVCKAGGVVADHEDLMLDWDPDNEVDPSTTTCGSPRIVEWICHDCGNRWTSSIYNRAHRGAGCPECVRKRMSTTTRMRYAKAKPFSDCPESRFWDDEKNTIPLSMQSAGSPDMRWFTCENGHSFQQEVRDVVKRGLVCKYCIEATPVDDPISDHEDLMAYWNDDDHDPKRTSTNMSMKLKWKCPACGSLFQSRVRPLVGFLAKGRKACPVCDFRTMVPGVNDLATTRPDLASELVDPSKASTVTERSDDKLEWYCMTNTDHGPYTTTPRQRVNGVGCKTCTALRRAKAKREKELQTAPLPGWIREYSDEQSRKTIDRNRLTPGDCRTIITITYPDCGHDRSTSVYNLLRSPSCPICACGQKTSAGQEAVFEYVKSIMPDNERDTVKYNYRISDEDRREVDIFVGSRNLAIEYNGLYWHDENHVGKDAAHDKWKTCMDNGIRLLTIWEDDWLLKRPIVEDMIRTKLGLADGRRTYARSCSVEFCPSSDLKGFLDSHHIQGAARGSVCSRLVNADGGTVAALVCSLSNKGKRMTIDRYASDGMVPGGFSRLLKHTIDRVEPDEVVTFSDNACSDGDLYKATGFRMDSELPPDYMYVIDNVRHHKFGFRKRRFMTDPNLKYDPTMTESELAMLNGLVRIYDVGKKKWILRVGH